MEEWKEDTLADIDTIDRFRTEQARNLEIALDEIRHSRKQSHWMWYIFPQLRGLGKSETAQYYGIRDFSEAQSFLRDPELGKNLVRLTEALLLQPQKSALAIFGAPDYLKLHSCLTLFYFAADGDGRQRIFRAALEKFFAGTFDEKTVEMIQGE